MSTLYLTRYGSPALGIAALVEQQPELIIVIPSYKEPNLLSTLKSVAASNQLHRTLVIPVINFSEEDSEEVKTDSQRLLEEVTKWAVDKSHKELQVTPVLCEFSKKKAGVGQARKTGMDEAVRIYEQFDVDGVIVNLDADCQVDLQYIPTIIRHFKERSEANAASIYFEHPVEIPQLDEAIIHYELHLRYFINMQRYCMLPYAYQTVGSAMAVRSLAYQKQGGMNKRKAGEDFYFLQKMMLLGGFTEINDTVIFPSSRLSDRVPFGTGRAMIEWEGGAGKGSCSYHPESFIILKTFLDMLPEIFYQNLNLLKGRVPLLVWEFMASQELADSLMEIKGRSNDLGTFLRHFYSWFDGFKLMKYVHFSRDHFYPDEQLSYCVRWLFENVLKRKAPATMLDALLILREEDRKGGYQLGFDSY